MSFNAYLVLFAFCVLMFQLCSKIAIELYETESFMDPNLGRTSSPMYLASLIGIFSSLYTGAESLYRMVKIKEKEAANYGRKSDSYYFKS